MNRSTYFNYIEEKMNILSYRIGKRAKINLLDLNIYSEPFFADMFSILLGYNFKNLNVITQNMAGIDLIDQDNKIIAQVSSTCTKQKINDSLKKKIYEQYFEYRFVFIAIAGEADSLRDKEYNVPDNIIFMPQNDIYDMTSILNIILNMSIDKQRELYYFIKEELGQEIDAVKVDSNLAAIINILSKEDLGDISGTIEINTFEIDRKIEYNNLNSARYTIDDYKVYYSKLNEKYVEFDKQGVNKSLSVFQILKKQYVQLANSNNSEYEIFYSIINNVIDIIRNSKNYIEIPYEELEMCVSIIVVDAFIKCKIFENPEGYNHVVT